MHLAQSGQTRQTAGLTCNLIAEGDFNDTGPTLAARGSNLDVGRRHILTSKADPRAVRAKHFVMAVDP